MEDGFYDQRLEEHGISSLVPEKDERELVHNIIFNELCKGIKKENSKENLMEIISGLERRGAKGIVLACTELPLLVKSGDVRLELFNTTLLHARKAAEMSLD